MASWEEHARNFSLLVHSAFSTVSECFCNYCFAYQNYYLDCLVCGTCMNTVEVISQSKMLDGTLLLQSFLSFSFDSRKLNCPLFFVKGHLAQTVR